MNSVGTVLVYKAWGSPVMGNLPTDKLYAVRHGQTGKLWVLGAMWHWSSRGALQEAWTLAMEHGLVKGRLTDHTVIEIGLVEHE